MTTEITIRRATEEEIFWVNNQYDQIGFKHSDYSNELIAIAEVNGERAGLGRLQRLTDNIAELGGMYVNEDFRGHGLAAKIVNYLLQHSDEYRQIYCLPFSHLEGFYQRFGFKPCQNLVEAPSAVVEKHSWCNATYKDKTLLFVLDKNT